LIDDYLVSQVAVDQDRHRIWLFERQVTAL